MQANLTYHTPTVESISELVHAFYADVRQDALLGPVFDEALNGQWDEHLHRLVDFWSTVLLGSRSFKGNVLGKHMQVTLRGESRRLPRLVGQVEHERPARCGGRQGIGHTDAAVAAATAARARDQIGRAHV